jgi:CheY-like chemotaxis protein
MLLSSLSLLRRALFFSDTSARSSAMPEASARVECIVRRHLDAVWRTARDLGVPDRDRDDVVQEVMLVVVRRLDDIQAERERAFVLGATARVAANWRRSRRRHPEELTESMDSVSGVYELPAGRAAFRGPEQALERSEKLQLLGDLGLPGVDGYEFARLVRAEPGGADIFLAALTGYGGSNVRQAAQDAGFDVHLTKPVTIEALSELIERRRR